MKEEKFDTDFCYYTDLIKSNKNFAFARYADGEVQLMKGNSVGKNSQAYMVDKWMSPNDMTLVGTQLLESLNHSDENYHFAISGKNDSIMDYNFLMERIPNTNLTFANLWINANYPKMKKFYNELDKEIYLICNYMANKENFPFKVKEIFPFPDDCISYFMEFGEDYITQLLEYITQIENKTFFISAGPVSEILIHRMYTTNPNNQYIDVGSSIDEYVHGRMTRPYMIEGGKYSNEKSNFN
jgi:hypothetical protein